MKLKEYLQTCDRGQPISAAKFARRIGVSSMKISQILHHEGDMFLSTALRIEKATDGEVQPKDLIKKELWITPKRKQKKLKS